VVKQNPQRFRYIVFRIQSEKIVTEQQIIDNLENNLAEFNFRLVYFDGQIGIVRSVHIAKQKTMAVLNATRYIGDVKVEIKTIGSSGTIRKAKSKYLI